MHLNIVQTPARSASAEASPLSVIMSPSKLRHMAVSVQNASQHTCRAALMTFDVDQGAQDTSKR